MTDDQFTSLKALDIPFIYQRQVPKVPLNIEY